MRILVDENIPKVTVMALREMGHDVRDIRGTIIEGIKDDGIWDLIQKENRILITTDKGFMQYRNNQHRGIIINLAYYKLISLFSSLYRAS